jgi:HEAT repeat protein
MTEQDLIQALLDTVAAGDDGRSEIVAQACTGRADLLPALAPLLAEGDVDRRWWITRTLALTGGPEAIPLLIERLSDEEESIRCAAAFALASMQAETAIPDLVAHLADPSGWVRDSAADALAMLGESSVHALIEAMADSRGGVRVRAASALRRIALAGPQPGADLDFHSPRGQAIGALFRALQDPNYLVHEHAFEALDRLGFLDNLIVI